MQWHDIRLPKSVCMQIAEQLSWLEEHQVRSKVLPLLMQWDLCHPKQVCTTQELCTLPFLLLQLLFQLGQCHNIPQVLMCIHLPAARDKFVPCQNTVKVKLYKP